MTYDYDYFVFGGGSGGVSTAKRAAINYGKKVAVVEGKYFGGYVMTVGTRRRKLV